MALNFATKVDYSVGSAPTDIVIADVNGDTKVDIITSNYNSASVSILFGSSNGSFSAPSEVSTIYPALDVALIDVNQDNVQDIVTIGTEDYESNHISVLTNNGVGGFDTATILRYDVEYIASVAVGDFNADGFDDIVATQHADIYDQDRFSAYVYQNNGDGTFSSEFELAVNGQPFEVITADIDKNGIDDIITVNDVENSISIFKGKVDGTFSVATKVNVGQTPVYVAVGDINNDGKLDIVTANYNAKTVSVLPGNGTGLFGIAPTFSVGINPTVVALGDMNTDGKLDIVTANSNGTVTVATGNGDGSFATALNASVGSNPSGLALQDLNKDGLLDIVVSNQNSNTVSVLLNTSSGNTTANTVGTANADTLNGTNKNDILQGLGGADSINGSAGNDQLFGGAGKDKLNGGTGNDILDGGARNDILTGGSGQDIFQFTNAYNVDTITDYSAIDDTIQLENTIFASLEKTGSLTVGFLRSGAGITSAADTNDYLIYNKTTGVLYYDDDANGTDSLAVKIAVLGTNTHPNLTAADIVVI